MNIPDRLCHAILDPGHILQQQGLSLAHRNDRVPNLVHILELADRPQ